MEMDLDLGVSRRDFVYYLGVATWLGGVKFVGAFYL